MDNTFDRELGARLKRARKAAGFAKAIHAAEAKPTIHVQSVRDHEAGRRGVPLEILPVYAQKYAVSVEWLLTGKGEMTSLEGLLDDLTLDRLTPESRREIVEYARWKVQQSKEGR